MYLYRLGQSFPTWGPRMAVGVHKSLKFVLGAMGGGPRLKKFWNRRARVFKTCSPYPRSY